MENLIVSVLLYVALVGFCFPRRSKQQPEQINIPKSKPDSLSPPLSPISFKSAPVIDISCIFDEQVEAVKPKQPSRSNLEQLTVKELRAQAKQLKIPSPYKLSKASLIKSINDCAA